MFGGGGHNPEEGTVLPLGKRAKTTFGGRNVFHEPPGKEFLGRDFGKIIGEEIEKLAISKAEDASDPRTIA